MACRSLLTRIVCISDTHSNHNFDIPDGDILIHAGDLTRSGRPDEFKQVINWLKTLKKFRLKLIIAGNHDIALDTTYYEKHWHRFHTKKYTDDLIGMFYDIKLQDKYGIIYLQDQLFIDPISQLKFYGRFVCLKR